MSDTTGYPLRSTLDEVCQEVQRARAAHPRYMSTHHAYGVLAEEVDEFWDEVKKKPTMRDKEAMRRELAQVAAVAIRAMEELT